MLSSVYRTGPTSTNLVEVVVPKEHNETHRRLFSGFFSHELFNHPSSKPLVNVLKLFGGNLENLNFPFAKTTRMGHFKCNRQF